MTGTPQATGTPPARVPQHSPLHSQAAPPRKCTGWPQAGAAPDPQCLGLRAQPHHFGVLVSPSTFWEGLRGGGHSLLLTQCGLPNHPQSDHNLGVTCSHSGGPSVPRIPGVTPFPRQCGVGGTRWDSSPGERGQSGAALSLTGCWGCVAPGSPRAPRVGQPLLAGPGSLFGVRRLRAMLQALPGLGGPAGHGDGFHGWGSSGKGSRRAEEPRGGTSIPQSGGEPHPGVRKLRQARVPSIPPVTLPTDAGAGSPLREDWGGWGEQTPPPL